MTTSDLQNLWMRFKNNKDKIARNTLIEHYSYLVKITAGRIITNPPQGLEKDDLIGAGAVGLIKAVDQFDSNRQVKFETYAIALIRGAILEMLREQEWMPRSIHDKVKQLERTYQQIETKLGRPANEDEVASSMGISTDELQVLLVHISRSTLLSLDELITCMEGNEKITLADMIDDPSLSPEKTVEVKVAIQMLGAAIDKLPEREKLVISLYYYDGLTFKEIGKVMTISESRVYQLHTQAVLRLKGNLIKDINIFQ